MQTETKETRYRRIRSELVGYVLELRARSFREDRYLSPAAARREALGLLSDDDRAFYEEITG